MRVKIIAEIREINNDAATVHCKITQEHSINILMPVAFEAMLKAMKDANKRAFYEAMAKFAEQDFDDAAEFFNGRARQ